MTLPLIITDAGRAAAVTASNTQAHVVITKAGLGSGLWSPGASVTDLQNKIKEIDTVAGGNPGPGQMHFEIIDETEGIYTLGEFGLYLEDGTLFAIYSQETPILSKTAEVPLLLAADVDISTLPPGSVTFGNTDFRYPQATESTKGVDRIATQEEVTAGENLFGIVVPARLKAWWDSARTWANIKNKPIGTAPDQIPLNSDLGTSATRDVGTGAENVMEVGAFGLGCKGFLPSTGADLNTDRPTGFYYSASGAANRPTGVNGFLHVERHSDMYANQRFTPFNSNSVYARSLINGVWTPWRMQFGRGNILGTVSQSGGVPTGAIIERGENANGVYIRWADGTQICVLGHAITATDLGDIDVNILQYGIYESGPIEVPLPANFSDAHVAVASSPCPYAAASRGVRAHGYRGTSGSNIYIKFYCNQSRIVSPARHDSIVIGKWC